MPKVVAIIQARMTSTRMPGKVLAKVLGIPLLEYQIERLKRVRNIDQIVVATTSLTSDDPIQALCEKLKIETFRGDEHDVLGRYFLAAQQYQADAIVRITGDCPLIDPTVVALVVQEFLSAGQSVDYVSNVLKRSYPRGLDCEIFSRQALDQVQQSATNSSEREHVTLYMVNRPDLFRQRNVSHPSDLSCYRLTVDTAEDFELIKRILCDLYPKSPQFTLAEVINVLELNPEWAKLNQHVEQKKA